MATAEADHASCHNISAVQPIQSDIVVPRERRMVALRAIRTFLPAVSLAFVVGCANVPTPHPRATLRAQAPLAGLDVPAQGDWPQTQWWRAYGDDQLDELMARAMQHAPDLVVAETRVNEARRSVRLVMAQSGLTVNGQAQIARQRLSEHSLIPSRFLGFNWYNQADLGAQLQYDFDWWGKQRAAIESAVDQAHATEAERSAAALTLQYAVADTYFAWQADTARATLAMHAVQTQQRLEGIARLRVAQGVDLPDTTLTASVQVATAREGQVALAGSAQIRHAVLAALLGVAPGELPLLQPRPLPRVKAQLPEHASLDLLARRPDIAADLWLVQAALKQTDVARAQFYPDVSISAMAGLSSIDLGSLLDSGSRVFAVTPALHLPIFSGGRLRANYRVAQARVDQAIAQYNAAVASAARDVATQALGARQIAARIQQQRSQVEADTRLVSTAHARKLQGVRDGREALAAQAMLLQQQDAMLQLEAQAVATDLNLIKALGGGYRFEGAHFPASAPGTPASSSLPESSRHDLD